MDHRDNRSGELLVRHVMTPDPLAVAPDAPLYVVLQLMTLNHVGAMMIEREGRLEGIFTERDLLRYAAEAPAGWRSRSVSDWMTRQLHTIGPDANWEEAVALMERVRVRHLPVIEGGKVIGLVSARDLIARRTEHLNQRVDERTAELQRLTNELMERDRQAQRNMVVAGRLLNRLLLPKSPPSWPDLSWAVHFRPLDPLGGDYYDFAVLDDRHLGVLIADASGHSLPAAMVAIMARIAFAEVGASTTSPSKVLAAMNRRLQGLADERFVTAFYGIYDRDSHRFTFANAGHPQPLHYRARAANCQRLGAVGFMLGILPDAVCEEQSISLAPGDKLCFLTDAVIDGRNPEGEAFGADRLEQSLLAHGTESAAVLVDCLVADILTHRGDRPAEDDCTLLVAACH